MDVHRKGRYTFAVEERRCEGNDSRVGGSQKLFHPQRLTGLAGEVERHRADDGTRNGDDA